MICRFCGGDPEAEVIASWTTHLPVESPSQNAITVKNAKGAFLKRRRYIELRDTYTSLLTDWRRRVSIPKQSGRRRVMLTRCFTGRCRPFDRGNLIGGFKPLLDAMVQAGVLIDDRAKYLEDHYAQLRVKATSTAGVLVEMEELA